MTHVIDTLKVLKEQRCRIANEAMGNDCKRRLPLLKLDIFTESEFSKENEAALLDEVGRLQLFEAEPCNGDNIQASIEIHRQTPLLDTVEKMATADILIPASSFLSAFAAYFHSSSSNVEADHILSLIIMPEEATRREKYLAPHLKYAKWKEAHAAAASDTICPIVSSARDQDIFEGLQRLLDCPN